MQRVSGAIKPVQKVESRVLARTRESKTLQSLLSMIGTSSSASAFGPSFRQFVFRIRFGLVTPSIVAYCINL